MCDFGFSTEQDCVLFRDYRELLARPDIDAVLVATGDRWHAPASIAAAQAGKDVYSEKPCGLTIANCRDLAETMSRTKRVFQAGTQRRSVPNFQLAVVQVLGQMRRYDDAETLVRRVRARATDDGVRTRADQLLTYITQARDYEARARQMQEESAARANESAARANALASAG